MAEETKEAGLATTLLVIGFFLGVTATIGSFISFIGPLAFFIGIPAAICSSIAITLVDFTGSKKTFSYIALTISFIGVVSSGLQHFSKTGTDEAPKHQLEQMQQETKQAH